MSSVYAHEPKTNGKVVLHTSLGDIDIELWGKECPKSARNFIQLCLEGYYDGIIVHRIIPNYLVQTGDPTGTGEGGESIYYNEKEELPCFDDEFHQLLKFNKRGSVAWASSGKNRNFSQFFITLDKTESLNGQHTIFGKVTGDTIFNVLKCNDYEIDEDDRPLFPPKIINTTVVINPFPDIVPRAKKEEAPPPTQKSKKAKGKKNFRLISFGDEAEEQEMAVSMVKTEIKSSALFSADPSTRKAAQKGLKLKEEAEQTETKEEGSNKEKQQPTQRTAPPFIDSAMFLGAFAGYIYKKDKKGLGYYLDKNHPKFNSKDFKIVVPKQDEDTLLTKEKLRLKKRKVEKEMLEKRKQEQAQQEEIIDEREKDQEQDKKDQVKEEQQRLQREILERRQEKKNREKKGGQQAEPQSEIEKRRQAFLASKGKGSNTQMFNKLDSFLQGLKVANQKTSKISPSPSSASSAKKQVDLEARLFAQDDEYFDESQNDDNAEDWKTHVLHFPEAESIKVSKSKDANDGLMVVDVFDYMSDEEHKKEVSEWGRHKKQLGYLGDKKEEKW